MHDAGNLDLRQLKGLGLSMAGFFGGIMSAAGINDHTTAAAATLASGFAMAAGMLSQADDNYSIRNTFRKNSSWLFALGGSVALAYATYEIRDGRPHLFLQSDETAITEQISSPLLERN